MKVEDDTRIVVQILGSEGVFPEHLEIACVDADGKEVRLPGH